MLSKCLHIVLLPDDSSGQFEGAHLSSQRRDPQHLVDLLQTFIVLQHRAQLAQQGSFIWLALGPGTAATHPVPLRDAVRRPGRELGVIVTSESKWPICLHR